MTYVILPAGTKPNITTTVSYTNVPSTKIWGITDVTSGAVAYPIWRIDSGGNVIVNLKDNEY